MAERQPHEKLGPLDFTSYGTHDFVYDTELAMLMENALAQTIQRGDVVIDAGCGRGLSSIQAARYGAKKVLGIDWDPESVQVARENARRNGMSGQIEIMHADATTVELDLPEKADVIMCGLLAFGLMELPQAAVLRNMLPHLKPGGKVIPLEIFNYVELLNAKEKLYGLLFNAEPRYKDLQGDKRLTTRELLWNTRLDQIIPAGDVAVRAAVQVQGRRGGTANAARLSSGVKFTRDGPIITTSNILMRSVVAFLPQRVEVRRGEDYNVGLSSEIGGSIREIEIAVQHARRNLS